MKSFLLRPPAILTCSLTVVAYRQVEGGVIEKPIEAVQIRLFTEQEGRVFLHPSSCLFKDNRYSGGFVVFHDRLKSTKLYLMDATTSAALPILLFGGQLTVSFALIISLIIETTRWTTNAASSSSTTGCASKRLHVWA